MRRAWGSLCALVIVAGVACRNEHPQEKAAGPAGQRPGPEEAFASPPNGYILFSPLLSGVTYLIDRKGNVVHAWRSDFPPGAAAVLRANGHLLRPARQSGFERLGGEGGRIQEFDWDGNLVWDWVVDERRMVPHHDVAPIPAGDVLLIAWERKTREEAIRAGRDPRRVAPAGLWSDCVFEIRPEPPAGGRVVWEWHAWDHLIQDRDPRLENFGSVSEHPELADVNGSRAEGFTDEMIARLKSLGYLAAGSGRKGRPTDFMHANSIAFDPALDRIALAVWSFNEVWVLDHSAGVREAAGHAGGRAGRGGDLLYRWGNPRAYGRGAATDERLFGPHDARWVAAGLPGEGHLTVFNNGSGRPGPHFSSVVEIAPPLESDGHYTIAAGRPFGPERPEWEYTASDRRSFFAEYLSSAQRLSNGDTLVCDGPAGRFFEVTATGRLVWEYENPFSGDLANPLGDPPRSVFRATFLPSDSRALDGRDLRPLDPQPQRR